jgi:hypothetical protein
MKKGLVRIVDAMHRDSFGGDGLMRLRHSTLEQLFGPINTWILATHFQRRPLRNVRTEIAPHVLAYSIKRIVSLIGV